MFASICENTQLYGADTQANSAMDLNPDPNRETRTEENSLSPLISMSDEPYLC